MSRCTLDTACSVCLSDTRLSLSLACFPKTVLLDFRSLIAVRTPRCTHHGLGSFHFARRYFGNRVFFLFLRVLRCFSSPGSLRIPMDSVYGDMGLPCRVSPFRNLRIIAYVQLPEAYRSLSRLSSALSAKASALCSWCFFSVMTLFQATTFLD